MLDIIKPRIEVYVDEKNPNKAEFIVEPLERGYAHTLGNSLRRVLLSSMPGAAITAVKIRGLDHEFTPVPGVREDYIDIILNLKGVVLKSTSNGPFEGRLKAKGPMIVTAGHLELPGEVEIVNPDHYIAEIADDGELDMWVRVETGRGYSPAERNKHEDDEIGVIPIDAIFSPVRVVTYRVENTRVGRRTDYDKLILTVETNGAMKPNEAVSVAAQIIKEHLILFEEQSDNEVGQIFQTYREEVRQVKATPIEVLELSVRPYNCLKRNGIHTLEQLLECSEEDLMNLRNFGQKSMEEIKQKLAERNLYLRNSK
ncbi:MAG: DNA-directed RNA polymerase subunit alpha [Actinobacteria bacterium]|nr:DNA-directed RNA polymerase subunit alpha [Actinomycetota bacterium]